MEVTKIKKMNATEKKQLNEFAIHAMNAIVSNNDVLDSISGESENESDIYTNVSKEAFNLAEAMMAESTKRTGVTKDIQKPILS